MHEKIILGVDPALLGSDTTVAMRVEIIDGEIVYTPISAEEMYLPIEEDTPYAQ